MKEIFTISLGSAGNFSSAYFWQIQDMYEQTGIFHHSLFIQTSQGYFPRMLAVDHKESMAIPGVSGVEERMLWTGKIQRIQQDLGTEEKWTDLVEGMVSRRNVVPVYRDESPNEEVEEKIRWFAEVSDKLQGIHALQDMSFCETTLMSLRILSDCYPKLPILLFSLGFSYSVDEALMLLGCEEFSNLLHLPCTMCTDKIGYSNVGVSLDALSYSYRLDLSLDMRPSLQDFFKSSKGNSAGVILNGVYLSPPGQIFYSKSFTRGLETEKIPTPQIFPSSPPSITTAELTLGKGLADFYSSFQSPPIFSTNIDDYRESQNYLEHLTETYSEYIIN